MSNIDGIINLNKPHGKTSFQMVALIRKMSGERKVGHSGTLDPNATGVLPILLGRATKLSRFITESTKVYQAGIEFGSSTSTYDSSGEITQKRDTSSLAIEQIESALTSFRGAIEQIPPMHSAIKHHGKPLYNLARAGIEIPRKSRKIKIFRIEILDWQKPVIHIEVECSKGTYIRSLAHDLGQVLGYGAHLKELVRIRSGVFNINKSVSTDQLEDGFQHDYWETFLNPLDTVISHLTPLVVDITNVSDIAHGRPFPPSDRQEYIAGEQYRAYSSDGRFIALLRFNQQDGLWQPEKVFV